MDINKVSIKFLQKLRCASLFKKTVFPSLLTVPSTFSPLALPSYHRPPPHSPHSLSSPPLPLPSPPSHPYKYFRQQEQTQSYLFWVRYFKSCLRWCLYCNKSMISECIDIPNVAICHIGSCMNS